MIASITLIPALLRAQPKYGWHHALVSLLARPGPGRHRHSELCLVELVLSHTAAAKELCLIAYIRPKPPHHSILQHLSSTAGCAHVCTATYVWQRGQSACSISASFADHPPHLPPQCWAALCLQLWQVLSGSCSSMVLTGKAVGTDASSNAGSRTAGYEALSGSSPIVRGPITSRVAHLLLAWRVCFCQLLPPPLLLL